jgi:hypothetical protein
MQQRLAVCEADSIPPVAGSGDRALDHVQVRADGKDGVVAERPFDPQGLRANADPVGDRRQQEADLELRSMRGRRGCPRG